MRTHPRPLPLNYDHDYDGRPPVEYDGYDPLLAALIRAHPEMIPVELLEQLATSWRRVSILASALD